MADAKTIGRRIARLRKAVKENQATTADAVGISRSTLAMIETGKDAVGLQTAIALADHFKVPLDYLVCRRIPPRGPLIGQFVENLDELALLNFWRSLNDNERIVLTSRLRIGTPSANTAD